MFLGPRGPLFYFLSLCISGVHVALFPPAFACVWAHGVRLARFPHVFACVWALGVRLGVFPPAVACFLSLEVLLDLLPPSKQTDTDFHVCVLALKIRTGCTQTNRQNDTNPKMEFN